MMKISPHNRIYSRGFTLVEVLIVMTLVALAASLVPPLLWKSEDRQVVTATARELVSGLRAARADAMARQTPVSFMLDLDDPSYRTSQQAAHSLPESLSLSVTVPDVFLSDRQAAIVFFPDGSSAGGRISLESNDHHQDIDVRWLTGRVSLVDAGAAGHDAR